MTKIVQSTLNQGIGRMVLVLSMFFISISTVMAKDLIFSTPPTQSPETTLKNYQPLVDYLSKAIGRTIVIDPAKSFPEYTRKMREGKYDMIFDGPHFIKWRIDKQHNVVVAKQPGELHFVIVVKKNSKYKELRDLWTKPVCSPPVPHLGTLTLLAIYNNPIREPQIIPVGSFKRGVECLRKGNGVAVLLRDKFWYKRVKDKSDLRIMYRTTRKMPARGLTVNSRFSKAARRKITEALTSKKGHEYSEKAFSTIGGGKFVRAHTEEFNNLDQLIKMVWGFEL